MSLSGINVRNVTATDITGIIRLSREVYPESWPWGRGQLTSQLENFPEGQFVATVEEKSPASGAGAPLERVIGFASGLIIRANGHSLMDAWSDTTEWGHFGNHDPIHGDTFYGAEVMVLPSYQGQGVGKLLYKAREQLVRKRGLRAIRAGARISGYRDYLKQHGLEDSETNVRHYVTQVSMGVLRDPTLSFQLKQGFRVIAVVPDYFNDPPSFDYAALIEWTP